MLSQESFRFLLDFFFVYSRDCVFSMPGTFVFFILLFSLTLKNISMVLNLVDTKLSFFVL